MELEDYIYVSMTQIVRGVKKLQNEQESLGILVNPSEIKEFSSDLYEIPKCKNDIKVLGRVVQMVKMEVSVEVKKNTQGGGGFSLSIPVASVSMGGEKHSENININKLSFCIPIALPCVDEK